MRIRIVFCFLLLMQVCNLQSQQFNWATHVTGSSYEYGIKAVKDDQGNTYIIGYSTGNPFEYNGVLYPTNGDGDAFFAKLDANKSLVWMKSIGGNDSVYHDQARDIHIDPFGDIYLTFSSSGQNFTYDGQVLGGIDSPGQYSGEAVLLKVNSNGNYLWHDSGTISSSFNGITTDAVGNVYITGHFDHSITLGGSITLTNPSTGTTKDLLVAKYQPNGTILWAKNAGGMPHNTFAYGYDIKIHPQTNAVFVLGKGDGEVYFDGVPMPTYNGSNGGIILLSYSPDGTQNWVRRVLDGQNNFNSYGISLDISSSGILGICGQTYNSGLVGFYTGDGSVISEHIYPSSGQLRVHSIAFNEFNDAYLSGWCDGTATFGISPGTATLSSSVNGFVAKMDILQQVKWLERFPSSTSSQLFYKDGSILYAGRIDSSFTYNSGQNVITNNTGDALFGEIIDYQLSSNRCNITGSVFQDLDADCILDLNDIVQKSIIVKAVDENGLTHFSITDVNGQYDIPVDIGSYTVEILPNPAQSLLIQQSCYTQQAVTLTTMGMDANGINFPLELSNCPLLNVDLCSDRRRRCFESNTYVSYNNLGFVQAENAEVKVQFPEHVTFVSSDHAYTIDGLGNYVFALGTLAPNESGVIHIVDYTQCIEGITGKTQCTKAWITPSNNCADALDPDFQNWDKSSIEINGACLNNSLVQFTITNVALPGLGDMLNPREYRIYVDNALALTSTFQLNGGESVVIDYPANGQTIRLEADQHPSHPGNSHPQYTVEGCGGPDVILTRGFVNTMPMDDEDIDVEIHCLEIIDSFDPNDKMVSPTGITENHYVKAGTTLEYIIRFQNTGTDTAYKVVVKDSLPEYLDPATIQFGVSSHPYLINITGSETPVLEFTFNNINLPHSAANETGSHGFVKFKATAYGSLENGIQINNNADIYFDYNYPILTNTVQNTISDMVLMQEPLAVQPHLYENVIVHPNPTSGLLFIEAGDFQKVEIYNICGTMLENSDKSLIDLSRYAKGIYFLKIITDNGSTLKKIVLK